MRLPFSLPSLPSPFASHSQQQRPPPPPSLPRSLSFTSQSTQDDYDDRLDNSPLLPQHYPRSSKEFEGDEEGIGKGDRRSFHRSQTRGGEPLHTGTLRRTRRSKRLLSLLQGTTLLIFTATVLFACFVAGWVFNLLYQRHNAYAQAVFSSPMIPRPVAVEGRVEAFSEGLGRSEGTEERFEAVQAELDGRFSELELPSALALPCASLSPSSDFYTRYSPLSSLSSASPSAVRTGPTLLALNLYNSAHVLPSLSRTLLSLSQFLEPETVHISIFENGSTDNTTFALAHLAAALTAAGVPHTITSDPRKTDWALVDRIEQLALYRNVALSPLTSPSSTNSSSPASDLSKAQDILFINDVFVCPADALELLFQRRAQGADAACGMDWREDKKSFLGRMLGRGGSVKFYDNWVSRSITGNLLRHKLDVFSEWRDGIKEVWDRKGDEYSRRRFEKGVAVPVYSCWNGMLALTAEPFLTSGTASRYDDGGTDEESWERTSPVELGGDVTRFRSALGSAGECSASECKTVARDLWTRGWDRWMIIPTVRTTYDLSSYLHPQLVALSSLLQPSTSTLSLSSPPPSSAPLSPTDELIDWHSLSPPETVVCFEWARGWHIDLEWWRASLEKPFAAARERVERAMKG